MGNCCGGDAPPPAGVTVSGKQVNAFAGPGYKLGSSGDLASSTGRGGNSLAATAPTEGSQRIVVNPNVDDEERERLRRERAAAAEERIKAKGGDPNPKKKKVDTGLKGPNSEPLMRWS